MVPDDSTSTTDDRSAIGSDPATEPTGSDGSVGATDPAGSTDRTDSAGLTDTSTTGDEDSASDPVDILVYGVIGGIAGSVLSFVPLATILGGVVAGYLDAGRPADGLKTGAVAGVVMALPFTALVLFVLFLLGVAGAPAEFGLLALAVVAVGVVYTVASGVLGGYLGNYIEREL